MATDRRTFLKGCLAGAGACLVGGTELWADPGPDLSSFDDNISMLNDLTRCVGCRGCQNACNQYHGLPPAGANALYDMPQGLEDTHYTVIKLYRDGEKQSFMKRQCMHCNFPSCESACPVGALQKQPRGHVTYDPAKCIGCRYCMVACPFNVPRFDFDSATPEIYKCNFCKDKVTRGSKPVCAETCPTGAITFGSRREMIAEAKRRLEAHPQRYIPHLYGETEAGGTSVLYLAGVPFADLGLRSFGPEPLPATAESVQHGIFKWFVTPIALFGLLGLARVANLKCDPVTDQDCIEEG